MYGPYNTVREAGADAAPHGTEFEQEPRQGNARREDALVNACRRAGIELGTYDRRVLDWLASWEPTTVQVIVGLISRANREED